MSHCGSVTADGSGIVDLTDKEVAKLEVDMSSWSEDYTVSLPPAIIEMTAEADEK